jgi:NADH-quinone oxidoreductase subunit J
VPLLAGAAGVVVARNPVNAAISLVVSFFFLAGMYILLTAHLLAFLQVLVYAGAIMVLFLFVIMLLNLQVEERSGSSLPLTMFAALGGGALCGLVLAGIHRTPLGDPVPVHAGFGGTEPLAERLFTVYLLPFELTSLLLLVAIVGAVVVGRKRGPS